MVREAGSPFDNVPGCILCEPGSQGDLLRIAGVVPSCPVTQVRGKVELVKHLVKLVKELDPNSWMARRCSAQAGATS